jgi:hypothetical protein
MRVRTIFAATAAGGALPFAWLLVGACSAAGGDPAAFWPDAAEDGSTTGFDVAIPPVGEDAPPSIFGDDANGATVDSAPASSCPGLAVPDDATSTACAIDTSGSCPACASWGFVCPSWAAPVMQGASAGSFCNATVFDGGALICCTQAACVVSIASGGCDASVATRFDCSGGAVPLGSCEWLGASAPNDYCCQ